MLVPLLAICTWALLGLVQAPGAAAHPQGMSSTNRYMRLEIYSDTMILHYVVDWSEVPTLIWEISVDADGDEHISDAEIAPFLHDTEAEFRQRILLTVDDRILDLEFEDQAIVHAPGDLGINVLRVSFAWRAQVPEGLEGLVQVRLIDSGLKYEPGWRVIVLKPAHGAEIDAFPELLEDESRALTRYPEEWLLFPPYDSEVTFSWLAGSGTPLDPGVTIDAAATPPASAPASGIERLFTGNSGGAFIIVALLLAFLFGVLEALGPGHAKATVASYLASSGAGLTEAARLSVVAAVAHSLIVYVIGALFLLGSAYFLPEAAESWLLAASGLIIVGVGAWLFIRSRRPASHHQHHGTGGTLVGIAGGLVPCPSSTLVMVAAVALGKVAWGMVLIATFSLGMAAVLFGIGAAVVSGRHVASRAVDRFSLQRVADFVPAASALLVVAAGLWVSFRGLGDLS